MMFQLDVAWQRVRLLALEENVRKIALAQQDTKALVQLIVDRMKKAILVDF
jgi:hypothetical protein